MTTLHRKACLLAVLLLGCSSGETASSTGPAPSGSSRTALPPASGASARPPPSAAPSASAVASAPPAFPPPALKPLIPEVAAPGDGEWAEMKIDGVSPAIVVRTALHPRKDNKGAVVHIVAFDFTKVELGLLPGTKEPVSPSVPFKDRPGLITTDQVKRLVAFTNGGWLSAHQGHGMRVGEFNFVAPQDRFCTLALTDTGQIRIGTWSRIKGDDAHFVWLRQNVPCLIEDGEKNPKIGTFERHMWGASMDGEKDIRRSAYAISKDGKVLFFAIGHLVDQEALANALAAADVQGACQMDINYAFTKFMFFDHVNEKGPVGSAPLMKDMTIAPFEGWSPGAGAVRDIFYLLRRPG
ncbi:MAG: hypothetical protein U0414_00540 [Polyangiaceae bacterium]